MQKVALAFLFCLLAGSGSVYAQIGNGTVAGLPAPGSFTNSVTIVTDGTTLVDCTAGGGSSWVTCRSNGSAWVAPYSPLAGSTSVTTLGTITTGTWNGTSIAVANGGTGAATLTGILQGNGTSAITAIANSTTVGQTFRVTGSNTYAWGALDLADTDAVTGTLPAGNHPSASDTASGIVELATPTETTTGTDAARAVTPDGLAGSDYGLDYFAGECIADATALTTGDGKCYIGPLPAKYNGWLIVAVSFGVGSVVSSSGAVTIDIDRCGVVATGIRCSGTNADVLSTNATIDANEDSTSTAAAASVIDTANDDLTTDQWLRVNVDGAGTSTTGLYYWIGVRKP